MNSVILYGTCIVVLAIAVLNYFVFGKRIKQRKFPVERGIPFFGIIPLLKEPLSAYLYNKATKHGDIFGFMFGARYAVILNNFSLIKKAFLDNVFSGRVNTGMDKVVEHGAGILFTDGEKWAKHRSFILKTLREFGYGKSESSEIVQGECKYLLDELDSLVGRSVNFAKLVPIYTVNVISKFIMNKRFNRDDENIKKIEELMKVEAEGDSLAYIIGLMYPFLDNRVWLCKIIAWFIYPLWKHFIFIQGYFRNEFNEHKAELQTISTKQDLIDCYLLEQKKMIAKYGHENTFTEIQMIVSAFHLLIAGYETTSTTLCWSLMLLSKHPEIQEQMHEEIKDIIGTERFPTMNDKKFLPFTQAVMDEIFRLSSVVPLAITHRTEDDVVVDGNFIPKNTAVFSNLYYCHRNPNTWKKPFEFYPNHFLDYTEDGKIKYVPREELIPFGLGKHQCLGEALARIEYFIFLVSIIQHFRFSFGEMITNEQYEKALSGNEGIIRSCSIKQYKFERR